MTETSDEKPLGPERVAGVYELAGVYFVGVTNGEPLVQNVSVCQTLELHLEAKNALKRFHNVRRVRLYIDPEPIRAPGNWGAIDEAEGE